MGRTPRVVVVGAGPGGLAAALLLAAAGASVTILEKDDVVGGRTRTITAPGGYRFGDYWRLGLPLSVIVLIVGVPLIAFFWPVVPG